MLDTQLMSSKAREDYKGSSRFIKNSRNIDAYLMANQKTTSHLRRSPPRHWSSAFSH